MFNLTLELHWERKKEGEAKAEEEKNTRANELIRDAETWTLISSNH